MEEVNSKVMVVLEDNIHEVKKEVNIQEAKVTIQMKEKKETMDIKMLEEKVILVDHKKVVILVHRNHKDIHHRNHKEDIQVPHHQATVGHLAALHQVIHLQIQQEEPDIRKNIIVDKRKVIRIVDRRHHQVIHNHNQKDMHHKEVVNNKMVILLQKEETQGIQALVEWNTQTMAHLVKVARHMVHQIHLVTVLIIQVIIHLKMEG